MISTKYIKSHFGINVDRKYTLKVNWVFSISINSNHYLNALSVSFWGNVSIIEIFMYVVKEFLLYFKVWCIHLTCKEYASNFKIQNPWRNPVFSVPYNLEFYVARASRTADFAINKKQGSDTDWIFCDREQPVEAGNCEYFWIVRVIVNGGQI